MFETLRPGAPRSLQRTVSYIGVEGHRSRAFKDGGYGGWGAPPKPRTRQRPRVLKRTRSLPRGYIGPYVPDADDASRVGRQLAPAVRRFIGRYGYAYGVWRGLRVLKPYLFGNEAPNSRYMFRLDGANCNHDCSSSGNMGWCTGYRLAWKGSFPCRIDGPITNINAYPVYSGSGGVVQTRVWNWYPQSNQWSTAGKILFYGGTPHAISRGLLQPPAWGSPLPGGMPEGNPNTFPEFQPIGDIVGPTNPPSVRDVWSRPDKYPFPQGHESGNGVPGGGGGTRLPPGRPQGSPDQSGLPVPRHELKPPGPGVKERKFRGRLPVSLRTFMNITSESMEWVDCAFDALGGKKAAIRQGFGTGDYGTFVSPKNRALFVYRNWQNMSPHDFVQFVSCVVNNHIEDKLIGKGAKQLERSRRIMWDKYGLNGPWAHGGMWVPKL